MNRGFLALLSAAAGGVILGLGLAISRMIDPQKVLGFLDFAAIPSGGWDPSLAFVMAGGVAVAFVGLRADRWMAAPLAAPAFRAPQRFEIDKPLLGGAAIFGVGWGLAGLCPGPALANLGLNPLAVGPFVAAMLLSAWATGLILRRPGDADAGKPLPV